MGCDRRSTTTMAWNCLLFGLTLSRLISAIYGQGSRPAQVPFPEVLARTGYSANFTCESFREPINYCLWERRGDNYMLISFSPGSDRSGIPSSTAGYSYTGDGLDRGSCGLVISIVKDEDRAQWECKLIPVSGTPFTGMVDVKILKKPSRPQLLDENDRLRNLIDPEVSRTEQGVILTCFAEGGNPAPSLKWFIGETEIQNPSPYIDTQDNMKNYTGQRLTGFQFNREHNGLYVKCVLIHETVSELEQNEYSVSREIIVQFPPRAASGYSPVIVDGIGERAIISVNISSNPIPEVTWFVGNDPPIAPRDTRQRYQAIQPIPVVNHSGLWEYKLEIFKLEEEDLRNTYRLRAQNQLGSPIDLEIRLSTTPAESGGLSAGGIVGLALGIPALIIIVAIIVVYTRAKGLLCFKGNDGTASEKERMDGGESATGPEEAAPKPKEKEDIPVTRRLSSRLSAIYENLQSMAKKKDKTAPLDEEANKEKQEGKEAAPTTGTETSPPTGTDGDKKPDDIVYAELDLTLDTNLKGKPPTVVVRSDDKTEYAEIVGVAPQPETTESTTKDKSPGGSPKK